MDTETPTNMTPILEGGEEFIEKISRFLETEDIPSTITLAEDCQPGA